jgi:hypothetical protein
MFLNGATLTIFPPAWPYLFPLIPSWLSNFYLLQFALTQHENPSRRTTGLGLVFIYNLFVVVAYALAYTQTDGTNPLRNIHVLPGFYFWIAAFLTLSLWVDNSSTGKGPAPSDHPKYIPSHRSVFFNNTSTNQAFIKKLEELGVPYVVKQRNGAQWVVWESGHDEAVASARAAGEAEAEKQREAWLNGQSKP